MKISTSKIYCYLIRLNTDEVKVCSMIIMLSLLAYSPLVGSLGFYWDDLVMVFFNATQGGAGFVDMFQSDRPFLSILYRMTSFLGNEPLLWQFFCISGRTILSVISWWTLKQIMPDKKETAFWIVLLLTVYPGFKQMPISYVWGNAFVLLNCFVFSFGCTLKALTASERKAKIIWGSAGLAAFTFCIISTEYYAGLELVRGLILWICIKRSDNNTRIAQNLKKVFRYWMPYLIILAIFIFWRVFVYGFPSYQPSLLDAIGQEPVSTLLALVERIIRDAFLSVWSAWTEFFRGPVSISSISRSDALFWAAVLVGFTICFFSLKRLCFQESGNDKKALSKVVLVGLLAVILPGIPFWITSLDVSIEFPKDRFLVCYWFGSCTLLVSLIQFFIRERTKRVFILSLFLAFAIGGNILNANSYRKDFLSQKNFSDQLQVRIPELDGKTLLLTADNSFRYETDNSLTGMVNLLLFPENSSLDLPVMVSSYDTRFHNKIDSILSGTIKQGFRNASFIGDGNDVLVYSYAPPACLKILDPSRDAVIPAFSDGTTELISISNLSNIIPDGSHNSAFADQLFGEINTESWCYSYEKAELLRQKEDWAGIVSLGNLTLNKHEAYDAVEYLPFIEAYAHEKQWAKVSDLLKRIEAMDKTISAAICPMINELFAEYPPETEEEAEYFRSQISLTECRGLF